jgi:hypothetical protein
MDMLAISLDFLNGAWKNDSQKLVDDSHLAFAVARTSSGPEVWSGELSDQYFFFQGESSTQLSNHFFYFFLGVAGPIFGSR